MQVGRALIALGLLVGWFAVIAFAAELSRELSLASIRIRLHHLRQLTPWRKRNLQPGKLAPAWQRFAHFRGFCDDVDLPPLRTGERTAQIWPPAPTGVTVIDARPMRYTYLTSFGRVAFTMPLSTWWGDALPSEIKPAPQEQGVMQ